MSKSSHLHLTRNIKLIFLVTCSSCCFLWMISLFLNVDESLQYEPDIIMTDLLQFVDVPPFFGKSQIGVTKFGIKAYANDQHKFMHCLIQKNTNTMFRNLWFAVERDDPLIYHLDTRENNDTDHEFHENLDIYWLDQREILNVDNTSYFERVRDEKWLKMVIIRDPLERLLSAFLDRCLWLWTEHQIDIECFGNVSDHFTFAEFVDRLISKTLQSEYVKNPHYWPQSWFCRLDETLKHYQMVIKYDRNTIARNTLDFLQRVNLSRFYRHWGPYFNETMFEDSVHVTFPNQIADVKSKVVFYRKYYTKELAMNVMALYSEVCSALKPSLFDKPAIGRIFHIESILESVANAGL